MKKNRCFLIGSHDADTGIIPALQAIVEKHTCEYGVRNFVIGNYGRFDRLAAGVVIKAKEKYPEITLTMLLPYHPAEHSVIVPDGFDDTWYPEGMEKVPKKLAIIKANQYAVDRSGYLIAYPKNQAGNSQKLVEYAKKKDIIISLLG